MTAQDFQPTPIGLQCTSGDDNRRVAPRRKVLKAGTIEFADTAIPCTVRSLSATGAAIEIASSKKVAFTPAKQLKDAVNG